MFGSEKKKAPFRKSRGNMAFAYPSSGAFFAWTGIARTALCIVSLSGVLFGAALVVDATVKKRNAPDERPMISEGYAAGCPSIGSELPPAMFNPSSRWTEGDMFLASATGERFDSPLTDPYWTAFVAEAAKNVKRSDGHPSIIERALPENVSEDGAMRIFSVYSYIREANPGLDALVALVQACAMDVYARETNLPLSLVVGVSQTESNFRPGAVSNMNARGTMQVMWKYHNGILKANGIPDEKHLHDPELGVAAGTIVLSRYLRAEQSIPGALARYYGKLENKYVGTTLSYKHAFELYESGISESWKNSMARERHFWNRMTGGREAVSASKAPPVPGTKENTGPSVVVSVTPSNTPAAAKRPAAAAKKPGPLPTSIRADSPSGTFVPGGNSITVVYKNGDRKSWKD